MDKFLRLLILVALGIFPGGFAFLGADEPTLGAYQKFRKDFGTKDCRDRLNELSEFKLLFGLPEFTAYLEDKKKFSELSRALSGWSTDLAIRLVFQIEQELGAVCPSREPLEKVALELKRNTLERLGISTAKLAKKPKVVDRLFRGTLALKDDREKIVKRVRELQKIGLVSEKALETLYGWSEEVNGVVVVGPKGFSSAGLKKLIGEECEKEAVGECRFWNRRAIYKVIISPESGLAAYIPELATLVFSQDLISDRNLLHKVIVLHELIHVAQRSVWLKSRQDWKKEFSSFSGWEEKENGWVAVPVKKVEGERKDELNQLSQGTIYTILPDPIYVAQEDAGKKVDRFVLGKSYQESIDRQDPSEDLADHVALYKYVPQRFCFEAKPLAPQKAAWIKKFVYPHVAEARCH